MMGRFYLSATARKGKPTQPTRNRLHHRFAKHTPYCLDVDINSCDRDGNGVGERRASFVMPSLAAVQPRLRRRSAAASVRSSGPPSAGIEPP